MLCFIWVKLFPFQHTGMNIRRLVALLDLLAQLLLLMKIRQVSHAAVSSLSNKTFMRIYTLLFLLQCNLSVHDAQECSYIKNIIILNAVVLYGINLCMRKLKFKKQVTEIR